MKKFIVLLTFVSLCGASYAQGKQFFDSPFGIGGGFIASWFIPNIDAVNQQTKSLGVPELSKSGFFGTGGAGYVYVGFVPGLRVGGFGIGGSTKQSASVNGFQDEVAYSSGLGGLTIEYTLPYVRKVAVSTGVVIGGGSTTIELSRHKGTFDWPTVWTEAGSGLTTDSYSRTLKSNYIILTPTLNVDIPLHRLVTFRVGAGYTFALSNTWKMDNDQDLQNVPSNARGGGLFINTGIFVGFFSY